MLVRKKQLNFREEREYLAWARIMQQEGLEIEIPDEWLKRSRSLDIKIAPPPDSEVFERPSGGLSYVIPVRLLSLARCIVEFVDIMVPWDDRIEPVSPDDKDGMCRFGALQFPAKQVLSSRIENGLKFPRAGEVVEGVILATGLWRFPEGYVTGQSVPFTLHLYDQYGDAMEEEGNLFVQRAGRSDRKDEGKGEDLFGNPRFRGAVAERPSHVSGGFQPRQFIQPAGGMEVSIPGASRYICTDAAKEDEVCGQ